MSQPPATRKKRNLIVNYVPGYMEEEQLFALFAECGQIKSLRIMRNPDGTGKGYGFVEFYHSESAEKAIEQLDGLRLGKKRLKVAFARPGGSRDGCNLFVKNLPMTWDTSRLAEEFSRYGELLECRVLSTSDSQSRRCGFVRFNMPRNAQSAIANMNGYIPPDGNFQIKVAPATKRYQQYNQNPVGQSYQSHQEQKQYGYPPVQQQYDPSPVGQSYQPHQEQRQYGYPPVQQQYQYEPYRHRDYQPPQSREWNQQSDPNRSQFPYQYQPDLASLSQEEEPFRPTSASPSRSDQGVTLVQQSLRSCNIVSEQYIPEDQEESRSIVLTNLPTFLQEDHVKHLCAKYGKVVKINIQRDNNSNSLGCAEVVFDHSNAKKAALEGLNGCVVWNKKISVN